MVRQLDLFNASKTTSYANTHQRIPLRLRTYGRGNERVEMQVNRRGMKSMRVNHQAMLSGGAHAGVAERGFLGKTFHLIRGTKATTRRASTGHSGG